MCYLISRGCSRLYCHFCRIEVLAFSQICGNVEAKSDEVGQIVRIEPAEVSERVSVRVDDVQQRELDQRRRRPEQHH